MPSRVLAKFKREQNGMKQERHILPNGLILTNYDTESKKWDRRKVEPDAANKIILVSLETGWKIYEFCDMPCEQVPAELIEKELRTF